jgi:serine phosphatase RsbU (regulator of sigma subunit)
VGRIILVASALVGVLAAAELVLGLPAALDVIRRILSLAWLGVLGGIGLTALARSRRAWLWRVRRKLVLSYVFLGVVPLVLVLALVVTGGALLYMSVAQYVFEDAVTDLVGDVDDLAEVIAHERDTDEAAFRAAFDRERQAQLPGYDDLSAAVLDAVPSGSRVVAGPWTHDDVPAGLPAWVVDRFSGLLVVADSPRPRFVIRAVARSHDGRRVAIVDLPMGPAAISAIDQRTGTRLVDVFARRCGEASTEPERQPSLFREAMVFVECTDWRDGTTHRIGVALDAPIATLSERLAQGPTSALSVGSTEGWWTVFVQLLGFLTVLFLVIQAAALVMGALLVRSITSAVHELAIGTERVQRGDFTHRIPLASRDQLGDLAESFNRMSGSIEHLLHVQREKQRLDDELRIARTIQRSLLPVRPPRVSGLDVADLCEPAREVGGDYYDFFELGPRLLGVIVADVSGKGTSAALYMAELKGLMLALSHSERSPRRLLVDVNRLLAEHLDNRNFITMTYAIVDLDAGLLTLARAGHTPALVVSSAGVESLVPDGMVLGLRLPGADARFEALLKEERRTLSPGNLVVLYTDGITEAMDASGDLFGEARLVEAILQARDLDAATIRGRVVEAVRRFSGDAEPHDDMTLVVIKVRDEAA